jgi:hypothetical protein
MDLETATTWEIFLIIAPLFFFSHGIGPLEDSETCL